MSPSAASTRPETKLLAVRRKPIVHVASAQTVSPEHVRAYALVARGVVASIDRAAFFSEHTSCTDASSACGAELVERAGTLLFRRPLRGDEASALTTLFDAVIADGGSFDEAGSAVVEAMLQSPGFLYLLEPERHAPGAPARRARDGYEMASRLSYFLWSSAPDAALLEAAASGALDTPEDAMREAERMLEDPRSRRSKERFLRDWALLDSLPDDDGLRPELIETATAFYADHAARGESLFELLRAPRAFLTPALAAAYGVPSAGPGVREYDLSGLPGRAGLLSQPGVLAGMTNADGGAIVARGLFLQRQIFCGTPPDPPATLGEAIDAFAAAQPPDASDRAIAEARLMRSECAACHMHFDPLAYAFERFDFRGAFRDTDEHGNTLSTDGWIPSSLRGEAGADAAYESIDDYVGLLADEPRVQRCMVQRQIEYAVGARLGSTHAPTVAELVGALRVGTASHTELVRALVAHDLFRIVALEPEAP